MGGRGERRAAKLANILSVLLSLLLLPAGALNIGVHSDDTAVSVNKQQECSRKCESEHCTVPPFLRYGKYCGILYSGCPGEKPCDALDACCQTHDACVQAHHNEYLSQECNGNLLDCISAVKEAGGATFSGNTCMVEEVVDVISVVIEAALLAGRVLHKP